MRTERGASLNQPSGQVRPDGASVSNAPARRACPEALPPEFDHLWEVRPGDRFLPYAATIWMNEHDHGWNYRVLDHAATTLPRAIKRGLAMNGSDDFNIAAIRDGRMVAVLWMEEIVDEEEHVIERIADALGVNA